MIKACRKDGVSQEKQDWGHEQRQEGAQQAGDEQDNREECHGIT
jgi:hypothetical protein